MLKNMKLHLLKKMKKQVQDSLLFDSRVDLEKIKYMLPELKLLKSPSKNEKIAQRMRI